MSIDSLIEERSLDDGEATLEERELAEATALYEARRSDMCDLAKQINPEEQCLT